MDVVLLHHTSVKSKLFSCCCVGHLAHSGARLELGVRCWRAAVHTSKQHGDVKPQYMFDVLHTLILTGEI